MDQYTFRVPPDGNGPAFFFKVVADSRPAAVTKARKLLCEQTQPPGYLHVDLTFGLTAGLLAVPENQINEDGMFRLKQNTASSLPEAIIMNSNS